MKTKPSHKIIKKNKYRTSTSEKTKINSKSKTELNLIDKDSKDEDLDFDKNGQIEESEEGFNLDGDDEDLILNEIKGLEAGKSFDVKNATASHDDPYENLNDLTESTIPAILSSKHKNSKELSNDPITRYLQEISRYKLLTPEEEKNLTKTLVETGDIEVAKQLVLANLRLVVKIAMEYRYAYQNILDLIQEGNIGLMKAVSKFNPEKGAKLSYYASWWIRSYILKYILDNFRLVKIGTTSDQKKLFYNLLKEKQRLMGQGIQPEVKLLSQNLGVSEKSVELMDLRLGQQETSLDRPLGGHEGGANGQNKGTLADLLAGDELPLDEQLAELQGVDILKNHLKDFVHNLKERDKDIFEKRLLSEIPQSLQSIADEYGVTRERIRQIEERLINKLKVYMSEFLR
jgi:RNA polymerase sigma-32 factor